MNSPKKQSTVSESRKRQGNGRVFFGPQPHSSHHLNQLGSAGKHGRKVLYSCGRCCKALWNLRIQVPQPKRTRKLNTSNIAKPSIVLTHHKKTSKTMILLDTIGSSEFDGLSKGAQNQKNAADKWMAFRTVHHHQVRLTSRPLVAFDMEWPRR